MQKLKCSLFQFFFARFGIVGIALSALPLNLSLAVQSEPLPLSSSLASACSSVGGKLIDVKTCQMPNGTTSQILSGLDAAQARNSSVSVKVRSPQSWALATTALMFEYNGDRHDTLSGTAATPAGQQKGVDLLAKWWSITSPTDLTKMLTWLRTVGHRTAFEDLGTRLVVLDDGQFADLLTQLAARDVPTNRLKVVRANFLTLGSRGILAWDLIRYIALCRWGYLAGYMSDAEAWNLILPAALRLQQTFDSWQDLESNFLIGREYWSADEVQRTGDQFRAIYDRLAADPQSPWNLNQWNQNLEITTPLSLIAH